MAKSELGKYFRKTVSLKPHVHSSVIAPGLVFSSDKNFGNLKFTMNTTPISAPFEMVMESHTHDFDQFLIFTGGDSNNMPDLGGVVELSLSKDGNKQELFTITEATVAFIPAGLYHCPLIFKKINDPKKPIIFSNLFFSHKYERKSKT